MKDFESPYLKGKSLEELVDDLAKPVAEPGSVVYESIQAAIAVRTQQRQDSTDGPTDPVRPAAASDIAAQPKKVRPTQPPPEIENAATRLERLQQMAARARASADELLDVSAIRRRFEPEAQIVTADQWRWEDLPDEHLRLLGEARRSLDEWNVHGVLTLRLLAPERIPEFGREDQRVRRCVVRTDALPGPSSEDVETVRRHVHEAFDSQLHRITRLPEAHASPQTLIVPDTNALLADPDLDQWVLGDRVSIVIVPDVVRELDAKKQVSHLSKRATSLINRFKEYGRRGDTLTGVKLAGTTHLREVAEPPSFDAGPSWLDPSNADDRILVSALNLAMRDLTSRVVLVTRDRNLANKARRLALPAADVADV